MGFFSDLKEDLSQAVNELMPEDTLVQQEPEELEAEISLEEMLNNIDLSTESEELSTDEGETESVQEDIADTESDDAESEESTQEEDEEPEKEIAVVAEPEQVVKEDTKGVEKTMDNYTTRVASDETSVITQGMTVTGDLTTEGSIEVIGAVNGNIDALGKLNITGYVNGNSKAAEIYADGAKINGEIVSDGAVKIGASSVIIGNISATSAAIAGAVKGDIDVKGPVVLDASAIVMGNIRSKSVQINNGAVIEGMCSQCYADVSPTSFFDDYKVENKKGHK